MGCIYASLGFSLLVICNNRRLDIGIVTSSFLATVGWLGKLFPEYCGLSLNQITSQRSCRICPTRTLSISFKEKCDFLALA